MLSSEDQSADPAEDEQLSVETGSLEAPTSSVGPSPAPSPDQPPEKKRVPLLQRFNIYSLLFVLVIVIAAIIIAVAFSSNKNGAKSPEIASQTLSEDAFKKLANSESTIGSNNQVLNVQSSAIFAGKVLARQGFEVAGNLQVGGTLGINNLTVGGTAQFGQAQINKDLAVAGNTSLQGTVTAKSLQVSGNGSFSGAVSAAQVTTSNLQLTGDLVLTRHITIGGSTPGRTNGGALGSGGTSSVSGSDTGGTISINTGGSPAAGCFVTVNFSNKYNATPRVLLTPVGNSAGSLTYYVNRAATSFSVCVASPAPASSSFGFDYFVFN